MGVGGGGGGGSGVGTRVAAVVVATEVVEGEAMVVTSTLGWVMGLSRTQWMQTQSVAKLGLLSSTCVLVFDVCSHWFNIRVLEYLAILLLLQ